MFSDNSLNRELTVRYDGHISLPRIGELQISNMTRTTAEAALLAQYTEIYHDPDLSLVVLEPNSKYYTVAGDVEKPGKYPYSSEISVWEAIQQAGGPRVQRFGLSANAANNADQIAKAYLIRNIDEQRKVYPLDLKDIENDGFYEGDSKITYDDIIYVPSGINLVYLIGETKNASVIQITEGMTLIKTLALAGGIELSSSRIKEIALLRQQSNGETAIIKKDVSAILKNKEDDVPMMPGDIIYIPRKKSVRIAEMVGRITDIMGSVVNLYSDAVGAVYSKQLSQNSLKSLDDDSFTLPDLPVVLGTRLLTQN